MSKLNKYLLFINLFFLQSYLLRFNIGPYPGNLQEILIALNLITFAATGPKIHWREHWIAATLIALTIFATISNEILSQIDLIRHAKFLFFASIFSFIALETLRGEKQRSEALNIAGYGALAFGIFSVAYNLLGFNVTHDYRLLGPLDAAVYLAYYLTPFFIFFVIKRRWWPALGLGLLILATRSMGAVGGSFLILSAYQLSQHKLNPRGKIALTTIGLLIAVGIFYTKILPTLQTNYSSLNERGEIWQTAAALLKDPQTALFGVGPSQFEANFIAKSDAVLGRPPLDYKVIQPHNIFLLFWLHYGILGLTFLIFLIYKNFRTKEKTVIHWMLLYFLIHGLIDTPFYKNDLLILLLLLLNFGSEPVIENEMRD